MTPKYSAQPDFENPYRSPLSAAAQETRQTALVMVEKALRDRRALLAYQPVVQARMPRRAAFYEGLIRIMDVNGRIIPAADFMDAVESKPLGRQIDCLALQMGL